MIRFVCPFCNFAISADADAAGTKTECVGCGKKVFIPAGRFDRGCIIGDFIIEAHLGKGSIGDVYKATQISLDRPVALKILTPKFMTKKGVADFLKEARQAATLSHMNLVQSYAVGVDGAYIYMAMTYISGETLRSRLKREGRIPVDESLHIIQQVAEALYYAWDECRIIHRDVKPDNIMLTDKGIVKLTDLGLAMNQADWYENMEISGSPSYMSPEQFAGSKLDTRSDIYSLGVTLYQMISGTLPFDAKTVTSVAKQHFWENPKPLNEVVTEVPVQVMLLVKKMMEKDISKRFANMEELLQEIWKIRQQTAPDRNLVPDIHTISFKRLDYDFQHEQAARNKKKAVQKEAARSSIRQSAKLRAKRRLIRSAVQSAVAIFAVSGIVFFTLHMLPEKKEYPELHRKVSAFEQLALDPAYPLEQLLREQEILLNEVQHAEKTVHYLADRINLLTLQRQYEALLREKTETDEMNTVLREKLGKRP